jgi:hypothetical protein
MKNTILTTLVTSALAWTACAGTESYSGKEMKQAVAPPPCPEWYADNEFNVSLWGAYAFKSTDYDRESMGDMFNVPLTTESPGRYDRFFGGAQAWGGGVDAKYFFHRYFGVGIEGFGLDAHESEYHFTDFGFGDRFRTSDHHAIGGVLGTLTLRYPIRCTRFSPYVWAGGGGIFGGENQRPIRGIFNGIPFTERVDRDEESRGMGQFGGGLEVRITPHIGWIADFSWNVLDGPHNNFGMARTGINFAF